MTELNWQWVTPGQEARAGNWRAAKVFPGDGYYFTPKWVVTHVDFGDLPQWVEGNKPAVAADKKFRKTGDAALASFLAWLASQPITLEHREGEYVHFECDANTHYQFVDGAWQNPDYPQVQATVRDIEDWNARFGVTAHGFLAPGVVHKHEPEPTKIRVAVYETGSVMVENRNGDAWVVDSVEAYKSDYDFDKSLEVAGGTHVLALGTFEAKS